MPTADVPQLALERDARSFRYFRNAVERHWDPGGIALETDRERLIDRDRDPAGFDALRRTLALFGAGEQAVTEDLAPLAVVLEDPNDQLFVTSQLYEEAKHADFFDRYWREVIQAVEDEDGLERTSPNDERWFSDDYGELFGRTEAAMDRLLEEDTPDNRARAYCHYHMVVEGVLAQTGYYGVQTNFSEEVAELPELPGLVEGFTKIRGDEGRHVGFGMAKLQELVDEQGVDPDLIRTTIEDLLPLTQGIVSASVTEETPGLPEETLVNYALEKHRERMDQILDDGADIPDVEELTRLAGD